MNVLRKSSADMESNLCDAMRKLCLALAPRRVPKTLAVAGIVLTGLGLGRTLAPYLGTVTPRLEVPTQVDLGRVWRGQRFEKKVYFHNRGNAPLSLKVVKTSCGCTSAWLDKGVFTPNERGAIHVRMEVPSSASRFRSVVALESNDLSAHITNLVFEGQAADLVTFSPATLDFGTIDRSDLPAIQSIILDFADGLGNAPDDEKDLTSESNFSYIKTRIDPGGKRLAAIVNPDAPTGELLRDVRIKYKGIVLTVPVHLRVKSRLNISPPRIFLPNVEANVSRTVLCDISGVDPSDEIVIIPNESSEFVLHATTTRSADGFHLAVTIKVPKNASIVAGELTLRVLRADPKLAVEEVVIPILANVRARAVQD